MRVHIEIDRREEVSFSTFRTSLGNYRRLAIKVDGRAFGCWFRLDDWHEDQESYMKNVDDRLAREFEFMIGKMLTGAMKMVPDGFDITSATDEEIRDVLASAESERIRKLEKGLGL